MGKQTAKDYIQDLEAENLSGSWGDKTWNRVHGDGKSSTKGKYHTERMKTSEETFKVKVVDRDNNEVWGKEYKNEPDAATFVADAKAEAG